MWLALWGCAEAPSTSAPIDDPDPSIRVFLDGAPGRKGGEVVVVVEAPRDQELDLPEPEVEGLSFEERGAPRVEQVGERVVVTRRFSFTGSPGHYEIPSLVVSWGDVHEAHSEPVWIDLGVEAPSQGELAEITDPSPVWTVPWATVGGAAGLGLLMAGGLYLAFRRNRHELDAPPEPPDLVALRAWDRVRRDDDLSDYERALALSRLFREYVEQALRFPATTFTTTETLERLTGLPHLPEGNVPRARRLLRATDRVKYADATAAGDLFVELDADLRAFVGSTRPKGFGDGAPT